MKIFNSIKITFLLLGIFCYGNSVVCATDSYSDYSVGRLKGSFAVGDMGNATYSVPIAVPDGGGFEPQISINYNSSLSGYGLLGYGFDLSGISVITREGENKFLDGVVSGVSYKSYDNYLLDGKRLVLKSGVKGFDGAVYTVYGDPYTLVTLHSTDGNTISWFEVKTKNCIIYQYGKTSSSCLNYIDKNGMRRIFAWYVNKCIDRHGNTIIFNYNTLDYKVYPTSIVFGQNERKERGITNKIVFEYEGLGSNKRVFALGERQGQVDRRIAAITSSSNDNVYRKYIFSYDDSGDKSWGKYSRLIGITEQNGGGEKKIPIEISWDYLSTPTIQSKSLDVVTNFSSSIDPVDYKSFFSVDLTGDGVSDIVQLADVRGKGMYAYISTSHVDKNGKITFDSSVLKRWYLGDFCNRVGLTDQVSGLSCCDIDGDGLNDLLLQSYENWADDNVYIRFYWIYGKDVKAGRTGNVYSYKRDLKFVKSLTLVDKKQDREKLAKDVEKYCPRSLPIDVDGDGKEDLFYIEACDYQGKYWGKVYYNIEIGKETTETEFAFSLPSKPEKIFKADYNNDGLQDIIILYNNGYKIYYNNGSADMSSLFTESNSISSTSFHDYWRISQGDFNGDGLMDFVYFPGEDKLSVILNNGDGTFTEPSTISGLGKLDWKETEDDDTMFSLNVADFDGDGMSDVMMATAEYEKKGKWYESDYYDYKSNRIQWFYSTGKKLELVYNYSTNREEDVRQRYIFTGDFDGDGKVEVANYGGAIDGSGNGFEEDKLNVYKLCSGEASSGKVVSIKDGINDLVQINYMYATNPNVYTVTSKNNAGHKGTITYIDGHQEMSGSDEMKIEYPVNIYTQPIPLVSSVCSTNGCIGLQTIRYTYEDYMQHVAGRGSLGFACVTKYDINTGGISKTQILDWDKNKLLPHKIKTENILEGKTSSVVTNYWNRDVGNNFFTCQIDKKILDFDGTESSSTTTYSVANGAMDFEGVWYENDLGDMTKQTTYDYNDSDNPVSPTLITHYQQHVDDVNDYVNVTFNVYDSDGNVVEKTENLLYDYDNETYEMTDNALTTIYTYDVYGNVLSSVQTGNGVAPITKYNEYDSSGRFVTKQYQNPASSVYIYTNDVWGNVIKTNDETELANVLTTTNKYDGWGRLVRKTSPSGISKDYKYEWGESDNPRKQYCILESEGRFSSFIITGRKTEYETVDYTSPRVKTWYDAVGHETLRETTGLSNTDVSKAIYYDSFGRISNIVNQTGNLSQSQYYVYDKFGRVIKDSLSTGKTTTYTYGKDFDGWLNTISINEDGRITKKSYDVWGGLVHVDDAIGGTTDYRYNSNGKPSEITSNGSCVLLEYDEVGNRISMTDPDAGTMTYEYAADGRILKQKDGRGIETTITYDKLGRVSSTKIGKTVISNTYGTIGTGKLRLIRQSIDENSVEYRYDMYGRIIEETKNVKGQDPLVYGYTYNKLGQLSESVYPGDLVVKYSYDKYGNRIKTVADGKVVFNHKSFDGKESVSSFLGKLSYVSTLDEHGFPSSIRVKNGSVEKDGMDFEFDPLTGNLLTRRRYGSYVQDLFDYDELDRLVSVTQKAFGRETGALQMDYDNNGNLTSKSDIGRYEYDEDFKPHAVIGVENKNSLLP